MADEFGNYFVYGTTLPILTTNPQRISQHENRLNEMSPFQRNRTIQGLRLLYYSATHNTAGVESALRHGADPNFTQYGEHDINNAMNKVLSLQNGHVEERLQIVKLLLDYGFLYDNDRSYTINRIYDYLPNLAEPGADDDLYDNYPSPQTEQQLLEILIDSLHITRNEDGLNPIVKDLINDVITKRLIKQQTTASTQYDELEARNQSRANPFGAQGTRDTVFDYLFGENAPYLSKEQRAMNKEDKYGGKNQSKRRNRRNRLSKRRVKKSRNNRK